MTAATAEVLTSHPHLRFAAKQHQYAIDTGQNVSRYTVTGGQRTLSYDLIWALGTARVSQSYSFKDGEQFYGARVTYLDKLKNLGFTPDRDLAAPKHLAGAMYLRVGIPGDITLFWLPYDSL